MPSMAGLPPLGWHALLTTWNLRAGWLIAGVLLLVLYGVAARAAARQGRPIHPARITCWAVGVVLMVLTVSSVFDAYAMSVFWVHMVEHLLLIMVVPAFLVLGHPLAASAAGMSDPRRERFLAGLRSAPIAVLTNPLTGLAAYTIVIVGTHLTSFMDQMAIHPWLMTAEQIVYVAAGWLFFLTLIGDEPIRWRLPYFFRIALLLVGMTPDTIVGIVLMQTQSNPWPVMMSMHPSWAPDPLFDVQTGGALMWAAGDGLMMCMAVGVTVALISADSRRAQFLGPWLENVRRSTLAEHVAEVGAEPATDVDPDSEEALEAYNRMLGRLNERGRS